MKKYILSNGLTILLEKRSTDSVTIMVTVRVGSNNEPENLLGISHFLEHMLFEGTKKRPSSTIIANEIERLGGELNAYTTNERTCFYIKVPKKHFDIALDIISDILQNPVFDKSAIEKERQIILKEINMVTDDPRFHQWILFQKTLFKKHPARNPTYGAIETVQKIRRDDLISYYNKHYTGTNMIISVVGGMGSIRDKIKRL
jgi:predicted Zn-dependent peptidase